MNVLLSCVGRRSYLVRYFQEALAGRGKVIATNSIPNTAGMLAADEAVLMPPIVDPRYPHAVIELCRQKKVGLICSLFDLDLETLAPFREKFEAVGARFALSSPEVINICFDKWKTFLFGRSLGLDMPKTYETTAAALADLAKGQISFPMIVKPRWGTGSIAIETAYDEGDLLAMVRHVNFLIDRSYLATARSECETGKAIIQEKLSGNEYGVDLVNDLSGKFVCCFVKKKLGMRSGETDAAVTVEDEGIVQIAKRIGRRLNHVGLMDIDIIRDGDRNCLLEMNPRFGGHYPFSHLAGANIPAALIAWARGDEPDPDCLRISFNVEGSKRIVPILVSTQDSRF